MDYGYMIAAQLTNISKNLAAIRTAVQFDCLWKLGLEQPLNIAYLTLMEVCQ